MNRPKSVTVIAWVWIVLGGLMFVSAAVGLLLAIILSLSGGTGTAPPPAHVFLVMHRVLCIVQLGVSVVAVIAGVHFLRQRAWARTVLEAMTWLMLIWIICVAIGGVIIIY